MSPGQPLNPMSEAGREVYLIAPDPLSFVSGGNAYNSCLYRALEELGIRMNHLIPDEFHKLNDQGVLLIDSYYLIEQLVSDWPSFEQFTTIFIAHHLRSLNPNSPSGLLPQEKDFLEKMHYILCTGNFTLDYLVKQGFQAGKCLLAEPAITHQFNRKPKKSAKLNALITSNIIERKGILPFLQSLEEASDGSALSILMAGSLDMEKEYADTCRSLCLNNPYLLKTVKFLGPQDQSSLRNLYEEAHCYVSPSLMETFGMSMQEAVQAKLPILALDRGNARRHVADGVNGKLCKDFKDMSRTLLDWSKDSSAFSRLFRYAEKFDGKYLHDWKLTAEVLLPVIT